MIHDRVPQNLAARCSGAMVQSPAQPCSAHSTSFGQPSRRLPNFLLEAVEGGGAVQIRGSNHVQVRLLLLAPTASNAASPSRMHFRRELRFAQVVFSTIVQFHHVPCNSRAPASGSWLRQLQPAKMYSSAVLAPTAQSRGKSSTNGASQGVGPAARRRRRRPCSMLGASPSEAAEGAHRLPDLTGRPLHARPPESMGALVD
mmetsp:Transcript_92996/g.300545  ORF Transcript_92996/g.300545 Transcript_92996/m.300545 type:complete len:201 (+) Transcript_92996:171-773(+)